MEKCDGIIRTETMDISDINGIIRENTQKDSVKENNEVVVEGYVHALRNFKDFAFLIIRTRQGIIQAVCDDKEKIDFPEMAVVRIKGVAEKDQRAPEGFEVKVRDIKILSLPHELSPVIMNKKRLNLNTENNLDLRPLTLRHPSLRSLFKVREGIVRGFRDFLYSEEFTEIHSPKIVCAGAEGGSNIFKLDYFGQKAFLAQSPQFYKQMLVGVYDRVFETGPVFRAEKHSTTRHLNEYTSLDFEMGYINDFYDIMNMETAMLKYVFSLLEKEYGRYMEELGIQLRQLDCIPCIRFDEAKEKIAQTYDRKIKDPYDLQPEEEQLIGKYFKEKHDSEFVFVTHYPSKKRPFYTMDDPSNPKFTFSFDLLYKGLEITTGGQRIHDYSQQYDKMVKNNMNPEDFESYLMLHKYAIPPHGGLGLGLERFIMQMAGEKNIRGASMFPRDRTRLEP